jgi:hypothetical protein
MANVGVICVHHPDRAGYATCMACRQVVCQECATTRDGINFCSPCLRKMHGTRAKKSQLYHLAAVLIQLSLLAGAFVAVSWVMAWAIAVVVGWR